MDALTTIASIATIICGLAVVIPNSTVWFSKLRNSIYFKIHAKNNARATIQLDSKFKLVDDVLFKKAVLMLLYSANEKKPVSVEFKIPNLEKLRIKKAKLEKINKPSEVEIKDTFIHQSIVLENQRLLDYLGTLIEKTFIGEIFAVLRVYLTHDEWVIFIRGYVSFEQKEDQQMAVKLMYG